MKRALAHVLAVASCAVSLSVSATPVTWSLSGITFDDGGTASGSFDYDAGTNAYSSINITTTAGSVRAGSPYTSPTDIGSAAVADFVDPALPVVVGVSERLVFWLAQAMTDLGGVINLVQGAEFTCTDLPCTYISGTEPGLDLRQVVSGGSITSAVGLSEPDSLALLSFTLAALAWRRRGCKARLVIASQNR